MDTLQIADLKATLPNFPDEVLVDWLLPYARLEGWPPFGRHNNNPQAARWLGLLAKKDLDYWKSVNWSLHYGHIELDEFDSDTKNKIIDIVYAATKGENNLCSARIPDLKERFDRIFSHLKSNGSLPGAPTLLKTENGLRAMDGNHRVAAYFFYRICPTTKNLFFQSQRFWVGAT